jgi:pimeloyl-ACP methyl ester carboxylesterase
VAGVDRGLLGSSGRGSIVTFDSAPCPVRIAWGTRDKVLPLPRYRIPMAAAVPGAELTLIPDVGHVPMLDDPAMTADMILSYIDEIAHRAKRRYPSPA